jgi:5-methylcytosine-specific restriction endonuclease McrA
MSAGNRHSSNTNDRGSAAQRRARKNWLIDVFGADVDIVTLAEYDDLHVAFVEVDELPLWDIDVEIHCEVEGSRTLAIIRGLGRPACRCFRCGKLVDYESMEVDRIKPGADGGTYARNNIRPCCCGCNKKLEGEARRKRNAKRKHRNELARERRLFAKNEMAVMTEFR